MLIAMAIGMSTITRVLNCRDSQSMAFPCLLALRTAGRVSPRSDCHARRAVATLHCRVRCRPGGVRGGERADPVDEPVEERGAIGRHGDVHVRRPLPMVAP